MKRIYDIIIPVYNGYNFVRPCYESIIQNTSPEHYIIIVDDASSEPALLEYYDTIKNHSNTIILRQTENRGFIHSVNTGMSYSKNQILLLNSDTIVTEKWLEKIDTALFSSANIGTATPWTNNGTICSYPNFCQDNEIPSGITPSQLSLFAENTCDNFYPEIPTAVGFCMAIKRELVDKVGLFNEKVFGRGYGEENDFCMRAINSGYINILDNRTFIYHKGSLTFKGEKQQQLEENLRKLGKLHPEYFSIVERFIAKDPLKLQRKRINRLVETTEKKSPHVLFLLHNDPLGGGTNHAGGTEYHVLELSEYLFRNNLAYPFILVSNTDTLTLLEPTSEGWDKSFKKLSKRITLNSPLNIEYKNLLNEILYIHHIDIIHIQHLIHHPHNINLYLQDWTGGLYYTLHDFYFLCPSHNLLDNDGKYCKGGNSKKCKTCFPQLSHINIDIANFWRTVQQENLSQADAVFVPSKNSKTIISNNIPSLSEKLIVRPHGSNFRVKNTIHKKKSIINKQLNIAFLGGLSQVKGSRFIVDLLKSPEVSKYNWFLFGNIGDPKLDKIELPNLLKHGRYEHGQLTELLQQNKIDIVVLCSIWPETFSYTLSEAWGAGVPVIVGPHGAPAERVMDSKGGWILESLVAEHFYQLLSRIASNTKDYQEKTDNVINLPLLSIKDMSMQYYHDYQNIMDSKELPFFRHRIEPLSWGLEENIPEHKNHGGVSLSSKKSKLKKVLYQMKSKASRLVNNPVNILKRWF